MIMVMGGTSEARDLVNHLDDSQVVYTTVTRNSTHLARFRHLPQVHLVGPLDRDQLSAAIRHNNIQKLIDATHPFAVRASLNAITACRECSIPYLRLERPPIKTPSSDLLRCVSNFDEAVKLIRDGDEPKAKRILLAIGINYLEYFRELIQNPDHTVYCQILNSPASWEQAKKYGILPESILAVEGVPIMEEVCSRLDKLRVDLMVFKESGYQGGTDAKIKAGLLTRTPMILINRPQIDYPVVFQKIEDVIPG